MRSLAASMARARLWRVTLLLIALAFWRPGAALAQRSLWTVDSSQCCGDQGCCDMSESGYHVRPLLGAPMGGYYGGYFRAGPAISIGDHPFATRQTPGVNIQGGWRQRLGCDPCDFLFVELGGSFMSVRGQRTEITPGFVASTVTNQSVNLPDLFSSTILDVRRAAFDVGFGGYFHPLAAWREPNRRLRATARGGTRFGTVYGRFHDVLTASGNAAIAQFGPAPSVRGLYSKTDTFIGLFGAGGVELILTEPDPRLRPRPFWTLGCEAEYSYDWINFRQFSKSPLEVISILATTTLIF